MYDSLLLSLGGGIISQSQKSKQYDGAAAVCIGIGGTGCAALSELKAKVYQQLIPDNPDEDIPKYQHIQFLAIDSDETAVAQIKGPGRFKDSEFFSIHMDNLRAMLKGKGKENIIKDPLLGWMDINKITELLSPDGAGGVRQVGRYLLFKKVAALKTRISEICTDALSDRGNTNLDIYVFAGISGGTGSGCFLDVCYILRQIMEERQWSGTARIYGFFFLPDVVTSKPEVSVKDEIVKYNNSNGYAAMKELDYLMSLSLANDWFEQNYGVFRVRTQEKPVDMCHLVSAIKADGQVITNGFGYSINVAADYVMSFLADVDTSGLTGTAVDPGITMRGHLANVNAAVDLLSRKHGANRAYHVMGASNAEMPMTQIGTYLAAKFFERMQSVVPRSVTLPKSEVDAWVTRSKLDARSVLGDLRYQTPSLQLPDINRKELQTMGIFPKGKSPSEWSTTGNKWLSDASGQRTKCKSALLSELTDYTYESITENSLIGRTFRRLYELCRSPSYGPYYAAAMISKSGYALVAAIDGAIDEAREDKENAELYFYGRDENGNLLDQSADRIVQANSVFARSPNQKNYAAFKDAVISYYRRLNDIREYEDLIQTLIDFRKMVLTLSSSYFDKFCDTLDSLRESFAADIDWLDTPAASTPTAYTWRILEFSDVKEDLDDAVRALDIDIEVKNFVDDLLSGYLDWISGDEEKIVKRISVYMEALFKEQMNKTLEDYLYRKYPQAIHATQLAEAVKNDIIARAHRSATPMFFQDNVNFSLDQESVGKSSFSVPGSAVAVSQAAEDFSGTNKDYVVRKTDLKDRIFVLRLCSGLPFYAYSGTTALKDTYDGAESAASGVGAHLFSNTGRKGYDDPSKDWRHFLPTPIPYSLDSEMEPDGEEGLKLYAAGEQKGIIKVDSTGQYVILQSGDITIPKYALEDFVDGDGTFNKAKHETALSGLRDMLSGLFDPDNCTPFIMRNDGDKDIDEETVTAVRKDYFLHYPRLRRIVKDELDKVTRLESAIAQLENIESEYASFTSDMNVFLDAIFYKLIECLDSTGAPNYEKIETIQYRYSTLRGEAATQIFSKGDAFPLYEAFESFRSLDPEKLPRSEITDNVTARAQENLKKGDNRVGRTLELVWTDRAKAELRTNIGRQTEERREKLTRFFDELFLGIRRFKDRFPAIQMWEDMSDGNNGQVTPSAPPAPRKWEIWDVSTNPSTRLTVYDQYPTWAYNEATGQWWRQLDPTTMMILKNNQYVYIQLDSEGKLIP